jgi:hypothetical protein
MGISGEECVSESYREDSLKQKNYSCLVTYPQCQIILFHFSREPNMLPNLNPKTQVRER